MMTPETMITVELTQAEKLRTTALMLAIQAYDHLIVRHAEMRSPDEPVIQPETINAIVDAAIGFEMFIRGKFSRLHIGSQSAEEDPCPTK